MVVVFIYVVLKYVFMDVFVNVGVLEFIDIVIFEDMLLLVGVPKLVGGYMETILWVIDVVFGVVV